MHAILSSGYALMALNGKCIEEKKKSNICDFANTKYDATISAYDRKLRTHEEMSRDIQKDGFRDCTASSKIPIFIHATYAQKNPLTES